MEFVEKNENVERIYSVSYDREKLEGLLDEIVKKASYRTDGQFTLPFGTKVDTKKNLIISGANLPNGDSMYENIKRIYYYTSNGSLSYHDDSIAVEGTRVTPPELAFIIESILSEKNSIWMLLNYANSEELISIDKKMANLDIKIDKMINFDVDKKIQALKNLKILYEKKKSGEYFDVELLKQYYSQTLSLFELELVSEKTIKNIKNSGRVLLKDYKLSNNNL